MGTLTAMGRSFEIILVDDGSSDRSWDLLTELHDQVSAKPARPAI